MSTQCFDCCKLVHIVYDHFDAAVVPPAFDRSQSRLRSIPRLRLNMSSTLPTLANQLRFASTPAALCHKRAARAGRTTLQSPLKSIKLICTDVDGTLLNSKNEMLESTKKAIKRASEAGIPVRCWQIARVCACAQRLAHVNHQAHLGAASVKLTCTGVCERSCKSMLTGCATSRTGRCTCNCMQTCIITRR